MADALYVKGAERIGRAQLNLETANIKAVLVKTSYIQDMVADEFYSDISAHVTSSPVTLTGKTFAGGKLDADDPTFLAVPVGDVCEAVVLFVDTGSEATSPLFARIDNIAGFPYTGNGGNRLVQWSNGAYKIFSLV